MRHYRQTPASRDAAAERSAQAMRDAGITPRPALDAPTAQKGAQP